MFDEQRISTQGLVQLPTTLTLNLHFAVRPPLVAWQLTRVVPGGKRLPEGGVQLTGRLAAQRLLACTSKKTGVPAGPAHCTTRFEGHSMLGRAGLGKQLVMAQHWTRLESSRAVRKQRLVPQAGWTFCTVTLKCR